MSLLLHNESAPTEHRALVSGQAPHGHRIGRLWMPRLSRIVGLLNVSTPALFPRLDIPMQSLRTVQNKSYL